MATSLISRTGQAMAVLLAWGCLLLTGPLAPARAAGPDTDLAEGPQARLSQRPREDVSGNVKPQEETHWLSKLADVMTGREVNPYARSHASVLNAFRATVELPAKCTVRIWCNGGQAALGTIIDSEGFIATKGSELSGPVTCELSDGTRHPARLVGIDRGSDLALLKIAAHNLPTIRWSDEDPPSVGGWVITPGLSDVPQAIGIVSVAPHHVRGGVLGIQMTEDQLGPRITYVVPGSGAAVAGLLPGDVIARVNGQLIETSNDMVATTSNLLPGDRIQLVILRAEEKEKITATLGSVATTLSSRRARFQDHLGGPLSKRRVLFPAALEHDSVLAPNQCGGVIVDLDGRAIGVNIARASRISSYAIPARVARPILESLKARASQPPTVPVATHLLKPELPKVPVRQ